MAAIYCLIGLFTPLIGGANISLQKNGHFRNPSLASSVSSRNTSNSSFASSASYGSRPKSAYGSRPQTSMNFNKSTTGRPISMAGPRPQTSMAQRRHQEDEDEDEESVPAQGRRKGMRPLTTFPYSVQSSQGYQTLPIKKSRGYQSILAPNKQNPVNKMRDVSVSTAMSRLQINEEAQRMRPKEHQAISNKMKSPLTPGSGQKASISTDPRKSRIVGSEGAIVLFQPPKETSVAPKTPSHIPVLSKSEALTTPASPSRTPKTGPLKKSYLSKASNITSFTAFDVEGRLENVETMYEKLMSQFSGSTAERDQFAEALSLSKARSRSL
jgi:kinesin family protein C1